MIGSPEGGPMTHSSEHVPRKALHRFPGRPFTGTVTLSASPCDGLPRFESPPKRPPAEAGAIPVVTAPGGCATEGSPPRKNLKAGFGYSLPCDPVRASTSAASRVHLTPGR